MMAGQKVVCVNDSFPPAVHPHVPNRPVKGTTYVIRDVCLGVSPAGDPGEVAVYLLGIHNPCSLNPPYPENAFNAERFRPLDDERLHIDEWELDRQLVWEPPWEPPQPLHAK